MGCLYVSSFTKKNNIEQDKINVQNEMDLFLDGHQ